MQVDIIRKEIFDQSKKYNLGRASSRKRFENLWKQMIEAESADLRRYQELGYTMSVQGGRLFFKK